MAWTREQMAQRAAQELQDGFYVNLGISLPTLVANYIPEGMDVWLQSENGLLGIGPFPKTHQWVHLVHGVLPNERLLFNVAICCLTGQCVEKMLFHFSPRGL